MYSCYSSKSYANEVLDRVMSMESYTFTNGFLGYHQVWIEYENKNKATSKIDCMIYFLTI